MIPLDRFLACVRENESRINGYEQGHDGSDGKSDCIGLIIGAVRLAGGTWPGTHGSNWAARNAMSDFGYINYVPGMFLGEIVYKAYEPGDPKWNLPAAYKNSPDQRDYYHVGIVTGVNPLQITHCTSVPGGIAFDTKIGNWRWGGKLKYVDYNEQEEPDMKTPYQAIVTADSGKTVNLRAKADIKSTIIDRVAVGDTVTVLDEMEEWDKVSHAGKNGYMMDKYLVPENDDETPDDENVTVRRAELEFWVESLEALIDEIRDKLGRG